MAERLQGRGIMTTKLPAAMQAIEIAEPGGPDVLRLGERPVPVPAPGQVLIEVAYAGVNRPDVLQRLGRYPPPPGASDIPGLEIAGTVVALGADHAINYRAQDFVEEVTTITRGKGAELCLDMVAGDYTQRNLDCLADDGRLVTIAVLGGAQAEMNMAKLMVRRQTITGSTLRGRPDAFKAALAEEIRREVWPLVARGRLRPAMDRIYPLAEAAAAHARMEAGEHVGKIVLEVKQP